MTGKPYEHRITGDGGNWGEIMSDAFDSLAADAAESCSERELQAFWMHVAGKASDSVATGGRHGVGTCEVEGFDDGIDEGMDGEWYSYAPPTWYLGCGHEAYGSERPCFCPSCGKRIVEEGV
jgi:hypothetical protein